MILEKYKLKYYTKKLKQLNLIESTSFFDKDEKDKIVTGITYNSKNVTEGNLFICKGSSFKVEYLEEAIRNGATAYVSEKKYNLGNDIPSLLVTDIQVAMAPIASIFYNYPQEKLKIIGIGGTKGKTTTSYFFKSLLDEYLEAQNKKKAGIISSIITYDGVKEEQSENTTPEAVELIRHLANAVESGLEYFVMEVSSQALKYHRVDGLNFELGIFLNIDKDHISPMEHPNYEDYLESKLKMFRQTKNLIINNETANREKILKRAELDAEDYQTFSLLTKDADFYAHDIKAEGFKTTFRISSNKSDDKYEISMPGLFNVENATAVIAGANILNIPQKYIKSSLSGVRVPGRTEFYETNDNKIIAVVDFAHNHLSFEKLYELIKNNYKDYRIVSIFGAPGNKALGRRAELGDIAGIESDFVYITMEDPAYEEVKDISEEIAMHVKKYNTPYRMIENRVEAIETAFSEVTEKTILLITGKGHETSNNIKGKSIPYATDMYYAKKYIEEYNKRNF